MGYDFFKTSRSHILSNIKSQSYLKYYQILE